MDAIRLLCCCLLTATLVQGVPYRNKLRDVNWMEVGQRALQDALKRKVNTGVAKNVILVIGDGMGISTITAARVFKAQEEKRSLAQTKLSWEDFPYTAISMPYDVDQLTSDSSAGATALLAGVKTNHGVVGLKSKTIRRRCETEKLGKGVRTILHHSHDIGKWTGVVVNTRITSATPAASYAASAERKWEADDRSPPGCKDIAAQLVDDNDFIKVIFGGGRVNFIPNNETDPAYPDQPGRREDGRNLMETWKKKQSSKKSVTTEKVALVTDKAGFDKIDPSKTDYMMGLFEPDHMHFEVDRENITLNKDPEPSLENMVEKAIKLLQKGPNGYFLLIEGGRIDRGHHNGNAYRALTDTIALSDTVRKIKALTDEKDTLLVVTADHSHTFIINGYSHPDNDILGISRSVITGQEDDLEVQLSKDGKPYLTLSYGNGPGFMYHRTNGSLDGIVPRKNVTEDDMSGRTRDKNYLQDAMWSRKSESHGGEDVAAYAIGPMSHLFTGVQEQSNIAHFMMYASCVGPNKAHCANQKGNSATALLYDNAQFILTFVTFLAYFLRAI